MASRRSTINFRPILFVIGILLTTLSISMMLPAVADAVSGNRDWKVFLVASMATLFIGVMLLLSNQQRQFNLELKQAFILTTFSWVILTSFAALPFVFSDLDMSYTDAFFEAMSGITTTGSTVITGLDNAPPGILLWRALLQWLGGVGIIVMAVAIMPLLQVGGMQLFRMESSDHSEKFLPSASKTAGAIVVLYVILSILCMMGYWFAGMSEFDAIAHAMTTIATGGYSTHDLSMGFFQNIYVEIVSIIFMIIGSLPFLLYLKMINIHPLTFFQDTQVKWFFSILVISVLTLAAWHSIQFDKNFFYSLRYSAFNSLSVMTGTGYATTAYDLWGTYALTLLFLLMFVGGCAGSTTCGIKIFRFQILYALAKTQIQKLVEPRRVIIAYFDNRPIPHGVPLSVLSFFFLFIASFAVIAMALSFTGLDFITSVSSAATAIANVGPGLGPVVGPAGNFAPLSDTAKWIMSAGMLLGRLELFAVLVLFVPKFWKY